MPRSIEEISNLVTQLLGSSLALETVVRKLSNAAVNDPDSMGRLEALINAERERLDSVGLTHVTKEFDHAVNRILLADDKE